LDDGSVEVAWVDRVIERLDYVWGCGLIGELYRVLKPGGRLRIETFDLGFLNRLASGKLGDSGADYVKWATDSFIPDAPGYDASFVVNHQMRAWGHRFLHDETTLADLLEAAGFREPVRCRCGQSQWEDLAGLESGPRAPGGFHVLETLVLETSKPVE
jgi:predicted SAM-dependent methyltransferase